MIKKLINKLLLGNTQLAGMRTIILNSIVLILALWEFATKDGGLFAFLCDQAATVAWLGWFCTISASAFYTSALVVVSALNNVLRWLSDTPVGVNPQDMPARMIVNKPEATSGVSIIVATAVSMSIASILAVILL